MAQRVRGARRLARSATQSYMCRMADRATTRPRPEGVTVRHGRGCPAREGGRCACRALTSLLFLLQPLARLIGWLGHGLTPWRQRGGARPAMPVPCAERLWSEDWQAIDTWLGKVEQTLRASGTAVLRGGDFERWDLEVRGGLLARARLRAGIEEHGAGRQLVRFGIWPRLAFPGLVLTLFFAALSMAAVIDDAWAAAAILAVLGLLVAGRAVYDAGAATGELLTAVRAPAIGEEQAQRTLDPALGESE